MATGHGRADYLLYADKEVVGVIEAKPEGTPLSPHCEAPVALTDLLDTPTTSAPISTLRM